MPENLEKIPDVPLASPENGNPEFLKFQTFLVTLSPKTDIMDKTIDEFVKYVKKKCVYWFIVTEIGDNGKKHLHACLVWQVPVDKRNIHDYWSKKMVQEYPGSIGRYAVKVTVQYNHGWYDEYLRKGGNILQDEYDREKVGEYFPTREQQSRLLEIKSGSETTRMHLFDELLREWVDKDPVETSYESAIQFMKHRMFVENKTPYYSDKRKLCEVCWFLYEKRNQLIKPITEELNFGARMTGNYVRC